MKVFLGIFMLAFITGTTAHADHHHACSSSTDCCGKKAEKVNIISVISTKMLAINPDNYRPVKNGRVSKTNLASFKSDGGYPGIAYEDSEHGIICLFDKIKNKSVWIYASSVKIDRCKEDLLSANMPRQNVVTSTMSGAGGECQKGANHEK